MTTGLRLVDDDGVEEPFASDRRDHRVVEIVQTLPEHMPESLRALDEVFFAHDLEGPHGDGAAERVAAVRGAVRAGLDGQHDGFGPEHGGDGVHAAGDGLAEEDEVGFDVGPFVAKEFPRAGDARLDLVADEKDVVFVAEGAGVAEVGGVWDDDAGFALDRLDEEGGCFGAVRFEGGG